MKVKVIKDGPYLVSGSVPLNEKSIVEKDGLMDLVTTKEYEVQESYVLCRCGMSSTMPYCDGSHIHSDFDDGECPSDEEYLERAELFDGKVLNLYDDNRCAYARFCHKKKGDIWQIVLDNDDESVREALEIGEQCPTARLVLAHKNGDLIIPELKKEISIVYDEVLGVCAGIFVRGGIEIEAVDGGIYEKRSSYALCRCGSSLNKPFCDAMHVSIQFNNR